jgi:hypothetical protein
MQLRGWELTRASRIVIILLVVQHLGVAQVLAFAPVASAGPDPADRRQVLAALDVDIPLWPLSVLTEPDRLASAAVDEHRSRTIRPDPVPLPRRLPRAPPAA